MAGYDNRLSRVERDFDASRGAATLMREMGLRPFDEIEDDLEKRIRYFERNGDMLAAQRIEERTTLDVRVLRDGHWSYVESSELVPGDVLELHCKALRGGGKIWKFEGRALVDGQLCASAEFTAMMALKADG